MKNTVNLPGQSKEPISWQLLLKWNLRAKNIFKKDDINYNYCKNSYISCHSMTILKLTVKDIRPFIVFPAISSSYAVLFPFQT